MAINLAQTLRWKAGTPDENAMLKDLQGSILKNHGRNHTLHLFLKFNNPAGARQWIKNQVVPVLPNQLQQLLDAEHHNVDPCFSGPTFVGLMLSRAGYQALNIAANKQPTDGRFQSGMTAPAVVRRTRTRRWRTGMLTSSGRMPCSSLVRATLSPPPPCGTSWHPRWAPL